jgi:hypothetical protein
MESDCRACVINATLRRGLATYRLLGQRVCRRSVGARRIGLACRSISTADPQNCRNKPRMYMKTKEEVKKSRSQRLQQPSGGRRAPIQWQNRSPGHNGWLLSFSTSCLVTPELGEQSENVYENKEQGQNVMSPAGSSLFPTDGSPARCDNPASPVLESRFSNNGRPKGGT